HRGGMVGSFAAGGSERSLTWLDASSPAALSADGLTLLFLDRGDAADMRVVDAYLRKTDGSPAVRLGEGFPLDLSPDGKWALVHREVPKGHLVLLPTGAGQEKEIPSGSAVPVFWAQFHPDGKRIFLMGERPGDAMAIYEQSLESSAQRLITHVPQGCNCALSPEGSQLATVDNDRNLIIARTDSITGAGASPRTVARLAGKEGPIHWSADGRALLIADESRFPIRVDRLEVSSGRRSFWRYVSGEGQPSGLAVSANEQAWVVGYSRESSELQLIEGLQ
ncbi:MAG TPA: hypothetical protein VMH79_14185, partial [Thermoanaerobaculia bacterium]|nr:hypothetical protein [Thermoanaerobaculia bacterium]